MYLVGTFDPHFLRSFISDSDLLIIVGVLILVLDRKFSKDAGLEKGKEEVLAVLAGSISAEELSSLSKIFS